jgi:hypothetical protein
VAALEDESKDATWFEGVRLVQADTTGGYRDWVLPNMAQLRLMYEKSEEIGGFTSDAYWSSNTKGRSQNLSNGGTIFLDTAYILLFTTGYAGAENDIGKDYTDEEDTVGIRAVRVF